MSIQNFLSDPESYAKAHKVMFGNIGPALAGLRERRRIQHPGWSSIEYEPAPGAAPLDFSFHGDTTAAGQHVRLGRDAIHTILGQAGQQDRGICFLPWAQDAVTLLRIPETATTFFTGPLTGCSVHIAEGPADGSVWAFHANRNAVQGNDNAAVKQAMTRLTTRALPQDLRGRHTVVHGRDYQDMAFVFGVRDGRGRWRFHIADLGLQAPRCRVAALP